MATFSYLLNQISLRGLAWLVLVKGGQSKILYINSIKKSRFKSATPLFWVNSEIRNNRYAYLIIDHYRIRHDTQTAKERMSLMI